MSIKKRAAQAAFQFGGTALNPVANFFRNTVGRVPGLRNLQSVVEMAYPARRVGPRVPSSQLGVDNLGRSLVRAPDVPSSLGRVGPKNALEQRILENAMKPQTPGRFQKLGDPGSVFKAITNPNTSLNPLKNPARLLNPLGTRGSLLYGIGLNQLGVDMPAGVEGALIGQGLGGMFGPGGRALGAIAGYDLSNPLSFADGTRDSKQAKKADEIGRIRDYDAQQGAGLDMVEIKKTATGPGVAPTPGDPSYDAFKAGGGREAIQRGVPLVDVIRQGQINIMNRQSAPVVDSNNPKDNRNVRDLPPSAEENKFITDPGITQAEIYQKAREAAKTPDQMKAVERLGSAIHRATNPSLYNSAGIFQNTQNPYNPLMKSTFPDRYPQSKEAYIRERGIQKPYSMINASEKEELKEAYQAGIDDAMLGLVEGPNPVLDPNTFLQLQLSRKIM